MKLQQIDEMLSLQKALNDATCGDGWEKGFTKENRLIDFARCIYMECAELIDSMPWKHWKNINSGCDFENIQIELVDIWHFLLSLAIMQGKTNEFKNTISELKFHPQKQDLNEILENARKLINESSAKSPDIKQITLIFIKLLELCGLEFSRLYKIYIGKNVLNKFRQDNGYKNGTYKKLWNGKEDNVIMYELIENDFNGFNDLYEQLDEIYKRIK